jgi:hypothetical protein
MRKVSASSLIITAAAALGIYALSTTSTAAETRGSYASLTTGGQSIVRALHRAQLLDYGYGKISLDRIAAMKTAASDWGPVFNQMKSGGLIAGRSLGLVILGPRRVAASRAQRSNSRAIVVTNAMGRQVNFFRSRLKRRGQSLPVQAVSCEAHMQFAGTAPSIVSGVTAPATVRSALSGIRKGRGRGRTRKANK